MVALDPNLIPQVVVATMTLEAIDQALAYDQGNKYRALLKKNLPLCEDVYRQDKGDPTVRRLPSSRLGVSRLGKQCDRLLWLQFRWAGYAKPVDPKMLRLFNRGHLEEGRLISLLELINCEIWQFTAEGKQYMMSGYGGHLGGALDGVIKGVPEMPDTPMLLEMKTHNDKYFQQVKDNGVKIGYPDHNVQMQIYMGYFNLTHAFYLATNKNTDELYAEIIEFDPNSFHKYNKRAANIIFNDVAPARVSIDRNKSPCRFCDAADLCHGAPPVIPITCRSCKYSTATEDGNFKCRYHKIPLDRKMQSQGCDYYELNLSIIEK